MALVDTTWYVNFGNGTSTGHYAVTVRPQNAAVAAGLLVRQFTAPAVNSERVFICIVAGTTANVTDATWVLTRGAKTTDGTATWQECTGQAALNGDLTNTATWAQVKAATPAVLGQIIKRSNNASYQICTTAGAMSASEPTFSDTAGVTTTDTTAVWTSLGAVGNFTGGMAPHARLANSFGPTWFAPSNTIYVADNHAETQGTNITLNPATTVLSKILCHNHSGSYPPAAGDLTTGATITATTINSITIGTLVGPLYIYGITFSAGTATNNANFIMGATTATCTYILDNCSIILGGSSSSNFIQCGNGATGAWSNLVFNNVTVKFTHVAQKMLMQNCQFVWTNTGQVLVSGSSVPTALITSWSGGTGNFSTVLLEAIDLSQLTGSLYSNAAGSSIGSVIIKDCKLNAAATVTQPINTGMIVQLIRCDSAATAYKSSRYAYEGTETTETSIVRTGGAVDPTGQAQSRKIATTANAQWLRPFNAEPYAIWNVTTAANVTVTVYGTVNSASLPNNDDIWIEVEYLGSASYPLGTIVITTKASVLASNAAVSSDSSSWNGGGSGAGWSPFKLTVTVTPGMAGVIEARIRAAKASTTYYIDPQIVLT